MIFDCHHYECYNLVSSKLSPEKPVINIEDYMDRIVQTWKNRGIRPLFHISEQRKDSRIGAHSDFIEKFPEYYLSFPEKYGDLDIEIEAKLKEQAILRLYDIYPFLVYKSLSSPKKKKIVITDDPKKKKIVITDD